MVGRVVLQLLTVGVIGVAILPAAASPSGSGMLVRGPEEEEEASTASPVSPVESTGSPVGSTNLPVGSTDSSVGSTDLPVGSTVSPVTSSPVTSSPVTGSPVELISSPGESTGAPVESTGLPKESAGSPVGSTGSPVDSTGSPVGSTISPETAEATTMPPEQPTAAQVSPGPPQSPTVVYPVPTLSTVTKQSPVSPVSPVTTASPVPSVSPVLSPVVITTWDYQQAVARAWQVLQQEKRSALDAVEEGCSLCEAMQCRGTVGYGGSPDEAGETTLDAMIMDGVTMNVGGVAALRRVRSAISVARRVMDSTAHSLLAGSQATRFALQMGFPEETLSTSSSQAMWRDWLLGHCQPNFWRGGLSPDPRKSCGPYRPVRGAADGNSGDAMRPLAVVDTWHHDTIGMVAMDSEQRLAAGTSTNGARHKIAGRVGDSPIAGAGAYADQEVGAAAATGDGDIMMRFVPSFLAVELMRGGASPEEAANTAIRRIGSRFPEFSGALIVLRRDGQYAAACHNLPVRSFPNGFPLTVRSAAEDKVTIKYYECQGNSTAPLQASVSGYS